MFPFDCGIAEYAWIGRLPALVLMQKFTDDIVKKIFRDIFHYMLTIELFAQCFCRRNAFCRTAQIISANSICGIFPQFECPSDDAESAVCEEICRHGAIYAAGKCNENGYMFCSSCHYWIISVPNAMSPVIIESFSNVCEISGFRLHAKNIVNAHSTIAIEDMNT